MFGTIRRHQHWLWIVIIAIIIVTFVIFFSPDAKWKSTANYNYGSIHGRSVSREEFMQARNDAMLSYRLNRGSWPGRDEASRFGFDLDQQTRQRLLLVEKLKELKIQADDLAVAREIRQIFQKRGGTDFDNEVYQAFVKRVLPEAGMTEDDLYRFFRHNLGIQQLNNIAGLAGKLTTRRAAEGFYQRENEQTLASLVFFEATNYLSSVTVTPEAVGQYFTNQMSRYRISPRVQVSYVQFAGSNFLGQADQLLAKEADLATRIDVLYQQRGANFFTGTNGLPLPPLEAKARIKEEVRQEIALRVAQTNAFQFANELFQMQPMKAANLAELARKKGLAVQDTEPFTEFEDLKGIKVPESFSRTAFNLTEEEPLASPVKGFDAVYLLALKRKLPSEVPPLDSLRAKVTTDYRNSKADSAAQEAGRKFYQTATNGLAQGKSFDAICKEARVTAVEAPPFSLTTRALPGLEERVSVSVLTELSGKVSPGAVSEFSRTREGGLVMFVKARQPVPKDKMEAALPAYMEEVREIKQNYVFNEWFRQEWERSGLATPAAR